MSWCQLAKERVPWRLVAKERVSGRQIAMERVSLVNSRKLRRNLTGIKEDQTFWDYCMVAMERVS